MNDIWRKCTFAYKKLTKTPPLSEYFTDFMYTHYSSQLPQLNACNNCVILQFPFNRKEHDIIMLASNNYLSLIIHTHVVEAGYNAFDKYG